MSWVPSNCNLCGVYQQMQLVMHARSINLQIHGSSMLDLQDHCVTASCMTRQLRFFPMQDLLVDLQLNVQIPEKYHSKLLLNYTKLYSSPSGLSDKIAKIARMAEKYPNPEQVYHWSFRIYNLVKLMGDITMHLTREPISRCKPASHELYPLLHWLGEASVVPMDLRDFNPEERLIILTNVPEQEHVLQLRYLKLAQCLLKMPGCPVDLIRGHVLKLGLLHQSVELEQMLTCVYQNGTRDNSSILLPFICRASQYIPPLRTRIRTMQLIHDFQDPKWLFQPVTGLEQCPAVLIIKEMVQVMQELNKWQHNIYAKCYGIIGHLFLESFSGTRVFEHSMFDDQTIFYNKRYAIQYLILMFKIVKQMLSGLQCTLVIEILEQHRARTFFRKLRRFPDESVQRQARSLESTLTQWQSHRTLMVDSDGE
ncbi:hypothetical protein EDD86DRAFT_7808 [Gorgonomyces haynaldii]|nr:hypothetical protein EDD86DRAFT_7808 [Gorgonomyces haynaldii]